MSHPARFQPGCTPGPGRPKGSVSGRARAVQLIDELITKHGDKLYDALEAEFLKNPPRFWLKYGATLLPQTLLAKVETTSTTHRWQSLLEANQENDRMQNELQALRQDYPGQDTRILGMLADGIPLAALRAQLGRATRYVGAGGE